MPGAFVLVAVLVVLVVLVVGLQVERPAASAASKVARPGRAAPEPLAGGVVLVERPPSPPFAPGRIRVAPLGRPVPREGLPRPLSPSPGGSGGVGWPGTPSPAPQATPHPPRPAEKMPVAGHGSGIVPPHPFYTPHTGRKIFALRAREEASMVYVYVAGPYTGDELENTRRMLKVGAELRDAGYYPFLPLLSHFWDLHEPAGYEVWMRLDLGWVERCDVLLRMPGASRGADREEAHARMLGIPVVYGMEELRTWVEVRTTPLEREVVARGRALIPPAEDAQALDAIDPRWRERPALGEGWRASSAFWQAVLRREGFADAAAFMDTIRAAEAAPAPTGRGECARCGVALSKHRRVEVGPFTFRFECGGTGVEG